MGSSQGAGGVVKKESGRIHERGFITEVCSEGMLTHLFFPVRKFGLGSGQIQMLVV